MANEENEKTEEATPKRKQKERDRGHISKSQDFTSSLMLTASLGLIFIMGGKMQEKFRAFRNTRNSINILNVFYTDLAKISVCVHKNNPPVFAIRLTFDRNLRKGSLCL